MFMCVGELEQLTVRWGAFVSVLICLRSHHWSSYNVMACCLKHPLFYFFFHLYYICKASYLHCHSIMGQATRIKPLFTFCAFIWDGSLSVNTQAYCFCENILFHIMNFHVPRTQLQQLSVCGKSCFIYCPSSVSPHPPPQDYFKQVPAIISSANTSIRYNIPGR